MRSTAGNENYKDRDGPPNELSHRRTQNLLLSIIARLCAKNADLWPLGWAVGIPGGAVGLQLVELGGALGGVVHHSARKHLSRNGYKEKYLCQLVWFHTRTETMTSGATENRQK